MPARSDYDAVVVGAGPSPNGIAAAITLARDGHSVLLLEAADMVGGGTRSAALTLPGFLHDTCSAIHLMTWRHPSFDLAACRPRHGVDPSAPSLGIPSTTARPPSWRAPSSARRRHWCGRARLATAPRRGHGALCTAMRGHTAVCWSLSSPAPAEDRFPRGKGTRVPSPTTSQLQMLKA